MKKGGFLRNVLDTIRLNQANQAGGAGTGSSNSGAGSGGRNAEFGGQLKASHFALSQVARHGFPENPTALAYDPVQKIAAIGTKSGALRVFGRPGVDVWAQHKPEYAVTHIKFIVNQGAIITVTADESVHLWSLRGPNLKLQLSTNASSNSPAQQQSHSPASAGNLSSISPQSAGGANAPSATSASSSLLHHHGQSNVDSGAQPGDPDYLSDQLSSSPISELYSRKPEILHTLKFQREHITCLHQTLMSKWLYIGTERGNVHVANVETFELSGYSIAWNKAIELSRKTHPGSIIHISECPQDTNKLLIGYESGCIVLWDLKGKNADGRYYHTENLLWLAWHYEGKQFVAAHGDGSLVTWQIRSNARPAQVLHPHAKTSPQQQEFSSNNQQQTESLLMQQQPSFAASSFARALNNELYRPINKVEWKTSKNNEQFLLFSGGLPYDGLEQQGEQSASGARHSTAATPSPILAFSGSARLTSQTSQQQQYFKASSVSPGAGGSSLASPSPSSPSVSPSSQVDSGHKSSASRQSQQASSQRKNLRLTSLTVMFGKSITVLEMDETIIDFITICDNSPYENDTSDPYAVIVLLANDLIIIDMTNSGYPSFDSPYPAASLNESPVTCVQYLADCSSDLIPFLYSTSQNVVSRAPKKGFSDKEWPINGGEWGQPMQSYPELVLTGHTDGTIKFWDMSGVNFDLISKIKTAKLFEKPNKLPNSIIIPSQHSASAHSAGFAGRRSTHSLSATGLTAGIGQVNKQSSPSPGDYQSTSDYSSSSTLQPSPKGGEYESTQGEQPVEENFFAIEKIEYFPKTKHLLVAGALSQIIQFRLNKKAEPPTAANSEITTILVEPAANIGSDVGQRQQQQHLLLRARSQPAASGGGTGSSSSTSSQRGRSSGFQAELICLTPLLVATEESGLSSSGGGGGGQTNVNNITYYCQAPPKVTVLSLQAMHSILAYAHEGGIVLVDIIQKCVIMSATLSDLYGGASIMNNNRDINIQPFATSSILQHHYQSTGAGGAGSLPLSGNNPSADFNTTRGNNSSNNSSANTDNAQSKLVRTVGDCESHDNDANDNGALAAPLNKSGGASASNGSAASQQQSVAPDESASCWALMKPARPTDDASVGCEQGLRQDEHHDGAGNDDHADHGKQAAAGAGDKDDELVGKPEAAAAAAAAATATGARSRSARHADLTATDGSAGTIVEVGVEPLAGCDNDGQHDGNSDDDKLSPIESGKETFEAATGSTAESFELVERGDQQQPSAETPAPEPRRRLVQAKSVAEPPVAPPRVRKRQSVPLSCCASNSGAPTTTAAAMAIAAGNQADAQPKLEAARVGLKVEDKPATIASNVGKPESCGLEGRNEKGLAAGAACDEISRSQPRQPQAPLPQQQQQPPQPQQGGHSTGTLAALFTKLMGKLASILIRLSWFSSLIRPPALVWCLARER